MIIFLLLLLLDQIKQKILVRSFYFHFNCWTEKREENNLGRTGQNPHVNGGYRYWMSSNLAQQEKVIFMFNFESSCLALKSYQCAPNF